MKKITLIVCAFISLTRFASGQANAVVDIDSLPSQGFKLNKGWRFYPADNPDYAQTNYNDKNWQPIDPSLPVPELPKAAQQGIFWMRIRLRINPALRPGASLVIVQSTALEIYLNGKLVGQRGTIDGELKTGRGFFDPKNPIELPLTNSSEQVLAIRVANQASLYYLNRYNQIVSAGIIFLNTPQLIRTNDEIYHLKYALVAGISILLFLAVLHIILFSYKAQNRGNLFFACYAICFAIYLFDAFLTFDLAYYADVMSYLGILGILFYVIGNLFGIKALYTLYKFIPGRTYKILIFICLTCFLTNVFIEGSKSYALWAVYVLGNGIQIWLTLKAIKHKKRGALFILTGFLISIIGIISLIHAGLNNELPDVLTVCMITLGPPLGISVFLGREFALDSQLLQLKLQQVEVLSAQALEQEIEKQQLLAKQNETLEQQVTARTAELNQSLVHLKATQTQLIQSEKMASLGELTAGIAHEIQNPLNFVNNFSELNAELVGEIKLEIEKGDLEEIKAIAIDIEENSKKINMHGKRAEGIVKGMLEHSRSASGQKEPTDINQLADEYLRMAYHGLKAKKQDFEAALITGFDERLQKANVVPQDIGRVLLNLFNNAFYAVNQKQKTRGADYKPEVSVSTSQENGQVIIKVTDNGIGIPDTIKEKILQPFFTTKPTGEGTGLGLSLSYDIIVKGHGGKINIESREGEGSEFIIDLPLN